jgi:hypothetical protein
MPYSPPVSAFIAASTIIIYFIECGKMNAINIKGANFCHVERIKQFIHEIDDITDGYHE